MSKWITLAYESIDLVNKNTHPSTDSPLWKKSLLFLLRVCGKINVTLIKPRFCLSVQSQAGIIMHDMIQEIAQRPNAQKIFGLFVNLGFYLAFWRQEKLIKLHSLGWEAPCQNCANTAGEWLRGCLLLIHPYWQDSCISNRLSLDMLTRDANYDELHSRNAI